MSANFIIGWLYTVGVIVSVFGAVGMGRKINATTAINFILWPVMVPILLLVSIVTAGRGK